MHKAFCIFLIADWLNCIFVTLQTEFLAVFTNLEFAFPDYPNIVVSISSLLILILHLFNTRYIRIEHANAVEKVGSNIKTMRY